MTTEEDTGLNLEKMGESDSVAKILDELFQKVKNAPEAKAAALKILIDQMYQVAAQMREERQVKQFQALQKQMVKHWKDIQTMCADTPELIDKLEAWKKR
ncbi:MAG: hypothetical protein QGG83_04830, partial [Candidatus Woesearchaeota archaeon]|nr:hypothetical protein [Candidatus Woesearchaeota archaeon]